MPDSNDIASTFGNAQQHYFVEIPGFAHVVLPSVQSFELREALGELYRITAVLMPCEWFGSTFEGACGYSEFFAFLLVCVLLSPSMGALAVFLARRRMKRA